MDILGNEIFPSGSGYKDVLSDWNPGIGLE
jgi:hypothetical protein